MNERGRARQRGTVIGGLAAITLVAVVAAAVAIGAPAGLACRRPNRGMLAVLGFGPLAHLESVRHAAPEAVGQGPRYRGRHRGAADRSAHDLRGRAGSAAHPPERDQLRSHVGLPLRSFPRVGALGGDRAPYGTAPGGGRRVSRRPSMPVLRELDRQCALHTSRSDRVENLVPLLVVQVRDASGESGGAATLLRRPDRSCARRAGSALSQKRPWNAM